MLAVVRDEAQTIRTCRQASWQYDRDADGQVRRDATLAHPRCVYQHLVRHFAHYTPEMVERACGIPRAEFEDLAERDGGLNWSD